jgi:hypothetical protein
MILRRFGFHLYAFTPASFRFDYAFASLISFLITLIRH